MFVCPGSPRSCKPQMGKMILYSNVMQLCLHWEDVGGLGSEKSNVVMMVTDSCLKAGGLHSSGCVQSW